MKKILVIISTLVLISCKEIVYVTEPEYITITKTDTVIVTKTPVGTTFNLQVDWQKINQMSNLMSHDNNSNNTVSPEITAVGTRLVYHKENAVFTQSVYKTTTSDISQLITLTVPPTDSADVFIVAVCRSCGPYTKVIKMGFKRAIKIKKDSSLVLTLDSLTVVDADWKVNEPVTTYSISGDTILMTRPTNVIDTITGESHNHLQITVTDPFKVGQWMNSDYIGFWGSGHTYNNPNARRLILIDVKERLTTFWPYIEGYKFGINGSLVIGNQGIVKTTFTND